MTDTKEQKIAVRANELRLKAEKAVDGALMLATAQIEVEEALEDAERTRKAADAAAENYRKKCYALDVVNGRITALGLLIGEWES